MTPLELYSYLEDLRVYLKATSISIHVDEIEELQLCFWGETDAVVVPIALSELITLDYEQLRQWFLVRVSMPENVIIH
jgi:hypothetical protein